MNNPTFSGKSFEWAQPLWDLWQSLVEFRESNRIVKYDDIVAWMSDHAHAGHAGAALLRRTDTGVEVFALVLDDTHSPVKGTDGRVLAARFRALTLDDELSAAFGDASVVLFQ